MPRSPRFTIPLLISLAFHVLVIGAAVLLSKEEMPPSVPTPVRIVELPRGALKGLPSVGRAMPFPHRSVIPHAPPGKRPDIELPGTAPGEKLPKGGDSIEEPSGKPEGSKRGPLPFLSQQDINELARRGYPHGGLMNDMLARETEAFKFLPYGRSLLAKLQKNARYPELAGITGLQGDVYVLFEIRKDGSLGTVELQKSSGYKILDDEVIRTIQASAPFQPLPPEWNKDRIVIPLVGVFRIYYVLIQ